MQSGYLYPVKSFRTLSLKRLRAGGTGVIETAYNLTIIRTCPIEGENKQIIKRKFRLGNGNGIPEEMTEKKLPDDFRLPKEAKKNSLF